MSGAKCKIPTIDGKSYTQYSAELAVWNASTDVPEKNRGSQIALSLPESGHKNIRSKVFANLTTEKLVAENSFKAVTDFMDKYLKGDNLEEVWNIFEQFIEFTREKDGNMSQYIADFDDLVNQLEKKNIKLPQIILAFMLIKKSKIEKNDVTIVLTGVDFTKEDNLYDQSKKSLMKFKGGSMGVSCDGIKTAIKLEPTWIAENEEVLAAHGFYRSDRFRGYSSARGGRGGFNRSRGGRHGGYYSPSPRQSPNTSPNRRQQRPINPKGYNGEILQCHCCDSTRHMLTDCPHKWENVKMVQEEKVVLFTGYNKQDTQLLDEESQGIKGVLDSACSSTVCGSRWYNCYVDNLDVTDRECIDEISPGSKIFKFGGGEKLPSLKTVKLPCTLAGTGLYIETDEVDSDIPLLL